jgi:hypothetical protein
MHRAIQWTGCFKKVVDTLAPSIWEKLSTLIRRRHVYADESCCIWPNIMHTFPSSNNSPKNWIRDFLGCCAMRHHGPAKCRYPTAALHDVTAPPPKKEPRILSSPWKPLISLKNWLCIILAHVQILLSHCSQKSFPLAASFPGDKTAGAWSWPSPPPSVEVKNAWRYTSTPNTSSWRGAY